MTTDAATPTLRRALALALAALAALLAPAAAQAASSASVAYGTLTYTADAGVANHVVVSSSGTTVQLSDDGAGVSIAPGRGCSGGGQSITCTGVNLLSLHVGDGDNFVDTTAAALPTGVSAGAGDDEIHTGPRSDVIDAGAGNDLLDGGAGSDYLVGGSGNDVFSARDGAVDGIVCGTGTDSGSADANDSRSSDCEAIDTAATSEPAPDAGGQQPATDASGSATGTTGSDPTAGVTTTGGTTEPGTTLPGGGAGVGGGQSNGGFDLTGPINLLPPLIPAQTASVSRSGVARVQVVCPAQAGACRGTIAIYLPAAQGTSAAHGKVVAARRRKLASVGRAKFAAAAGAKPMVPVRLNRRGRRRILRHRHKTVAQVVVTTRSASGAVHTSRRTITLRPRRTATRRRRA